MLAFKTFLCPQDVMFRSKAMFYIGDLRIRYSKPLSEYRHFCAHRTRFKGKAEGSWGQKNPQLAWYFKDDSFEGTFMKDVIRIGGGG